MVSYLLKPFRNIYIFHFFFFFYLVFIFYDYSYLDKKREDWSDSQMNTTGMMFIASPFMVWADYTWGKNSNIIGGATNATGFTSTVSPNSDKWLYRINLNIGFSF